MFRSVVNEVKGWRENKDSNEVQFVSVTEFILVFLIFYYSKVMWIYGYVLAEEMEVVGTAVWQCAVQLYCKLNAN